MDKNFIFLDTNILVNMISVFDINEIGKIVSNIYASPTVISEFKNEYMKAHKRFDKNNIKSNYKQKLTINSNLIFKDSEYKEYLSSDELRQQKESVEAKIQVLCKIYAEIEGDLEKYRDKIEEIKIDKEEKTPGIYKKINTKIKIVNGLTIEKKIQMLGICEMRYKNKIPPGYGDQKKTTMEKYNDIFIWIEFINHCKTEEIEGEIVFVTDDKKEDSSNNIAFLKQEFSEKTQREVILMDFDTFMKSEYLQFKGHSNEVSKSIVSPSIDLSMIGNLTNVTDNIANLLADISVPSMPIYNVSELIQDHQKIFDYYPESITNAAEFMQTYLARNDNKLHLSTTGIENFQPSKILCDNLIDKKEHKEI